MAQFPLSGILLFEFRMVGDHHPALRVTWGWPGPGPGKFENLSEILSKSERQCDNFPKSENQSSEDQKPEGENSEK